jgi:hypothetical protein
VIAVYDTSLTRRQYIHTLAGFGLVASVAGCSGDGTDGGTASTPTSGPDSPPGGGTPTDGSPSGSPSAGGGSGAQFDVTAVERTTVEGQGIMTILTVENGGTSDVELSEINRVGSSGPGTPLAGDNSAADFEFVNVDEVQSAPYDMVIHGGESHRFGIGGGHRVEGSGSNPCDGLEVTDSYRLLTASGSSIQVDVTFVYAEGTESAYEEGVYTCTRGSVSEFSTSS